MMAKKVEVHIDDEEVKSERLPKMSSGNLRSHKILDDDDSSEDNSKQMMAKKVEVHFDDKEDS